MGPSFGGYGGVFFRVVTTFDETVPLVAQPSGSQETGIFTYHKTISLSPMDYRLTIVAKDLANGRTVTRELTITVPGWRAEDGDAIKLD